MKEIVVASTPEEELPEKSRPEWLADKAALKKEFGNGKMAYVKWEGDDLIIIVDEKAAGKD